MTLGIEDADRVRLLTLDRPDVLNAFDDGLCAALLEALRNAATDDGIGAVVLTGAGRAFSSGQDLAEMARLQDPHADRPAHRFGAMLDAVAEFPKPLLAAVNGLGVGLGFTILLHCDLVLVSTAARVRAPFVELGVAPEAGSSYLLAERMGRQRAALVLFGGEWLDAADLVAAGVALRVCDPEALVPEALALARRVAAGPLPSLMATKRLLVAAHRDAVAAARRREEDAFAGLLGGGANAEALRRFGDRR